MLDEIRKIPDWSESVKRLWDEDTRKETPLRVVLLGSAPLLLRDGLTESLAERFELLRLPHWSFSEMRDAFGLTLEEYLCFGGYPGAAPLVDDFDRWAAYIRDSLIETTISRDVLLLTRIDKPGVSEPARRIGGRGPPGERGGGRGVRRPLLARARQRGRLRGRTAGCSHGD